jgi:hypothetical protein
LTLRCLSHALFATIAAVTGSAWLAVSPVNAGGSAPNVFTVANYPVEARAKDAITAKTTAIADGQQAALRSLLRRIVPVTSYRRLQAMPQVSAANLIDGVAVRDERSSQTEYIATLDFAFQPAAVRDLLRRNGLPYVDVQAPQTLVIPLYQARADAPIEAGRGSWFDAWKGLDLVQTVSPVKLETLKPGLPPETVRALTSGKGGAERIFTGEYKAERIVVALAEPDASGKKLTVTLVGIDASGPLKLVRSYRIPRGDAAYAAELAAVVSLGVLEGRWKAAKSGAIGGVDISESGGLQLVVEFATLAEWNAIRSKLLDAEGAFDVAVGSVSNRSAEVSLRHGGGQQGLSDALAAQGLTLVPIAGQLVVRSTF